MFEEETTLFPLIVVREHTSLVKQRYCLWFEIHDQIIIHVMWVNDGFSIPSRLQRKKSQKTAQKIKTNKLYIIYIAFLVANIVVPEGFAQQIVI